MSTYCISVETKEITTTAFVPNHIVKSVRIPRQSQQSRSQFKRPDTIRLFHKANSRAIKEESSDDEANIDQKSTITIRRIAEKKVEDNGKVYYSVDWSDNTKSKELPSSLNKIDHDAVEQFEHKTFRKILNV